eukprot:GFUD01126542.1.p1 GENE.GFUD01126542.1~~GFUD01126542.1.p1  ORF type:complete len:654 (-),score=198.54 GFUD01126542.1:388-2349(-)
MDKMMEETNECDIRLELTSSTAVSEDENEVTVENSPKNVSKDSGVNLTPTKSGPEVNLLIKDNIGSRRKHRLISDKVTVDEFMIDNGSIDSEPILINDDSYKIDESGAIEITDDAPEDNEEFIEVDAIGQVDQMDKAFMAGRDLPKDLNSEITVMDYEDGYGFSDGEIELSSDDEAPEASDVSLLCLKRPIPNETTIECLEILDSDEEYPVCLVESEKNDHVNIEEKRGYIKEYIETEGCGIIFSHTFGLVLFHLANVWVEGRQLSPSRTRDLLKIGTCLTFYDQSFRGEEYSALSSDGVFHQAVVAWTGERPRHLMKKIDSLGEGYMDTLENSRRTFMLYLRGEVFLRCALVRVKGMIVGYITDQIGVVECTEDGREKVNVFFHTDDVWIYRKPLRVYQQTYDTPATQLLPVGLNISVDARSVNIRGVSNLSYQAVCVLAGSWPSSPYPTLLPGGQGSYSQAFDITDEQKGTFYYLELSLEAKLGRKLEMLKEELAHTRGNVVFNWRNVDQVRSQEDAKLWREQFTNTDRPRRPPDSHRRTVQHAFRAPPPRVVKTKKELDDSSSVATAGGSSVSGLSGVSSKWSRPRSRLSQTSGMSSGSSYSVRGTTKESRRSWYSQENWGHGGLRIKTEVKTEPGMDQPGAAKKIKTES